MTLELVKSHIKICVLDWITLDYLTPCRRQKTYWYCDWLSKKYLWIIHLLLNSTSLKFFVVGEWKRKHLHDHRRQWWKLHIDIDAKTLQIGDCISIGI